MRAFDRNFHDTPPASDRLENRAAGTAPVEAGRDRTRRSGPAAGAVKVP
ncbi:hypothetical protein OCAR_4537 [Afipia carboxidovorans OM5]|nr:hypothetical protein OCAR_4537 [Afipia carboxidovorans OM5]